MASMPAPPIPVAPRLDTANDEPRLTQTMRNVMTKAVKKSITSSAKPAKRSRRKSHALPAKRPGKFDVIADRLELDKMERHPTSCQSFAGLLGFSLHLGADNPDRWSSQTGRVEMSQEKWVDHALKILGAAADFGAPLTPTQRKRFSELALFPLFKKRANAISDWRGAGAIETDEAQQLHSDVWEQFDADVEAMASADEGIYLDELTPTSCTYWGSQVHAQFKAKGGYPVTLAFSTASMMKLSDLLMDVVRNFGSRVVRDLRTPSDKSSAISDKSASDEKVVAPAAA
jgi:hypothetical protein